VYAGNGSLENKKKGKNFLCKNQKRRTKNVMEGGKQGSLRSELIDIERSKTQRERVKRNLINNRGGEEVNEFDRRKGGTREHL